jgi:hypothetical protein
MTQVSDDDLFSGGMTEFDPGAWLAAYWMTRFFNLIAEP